MRRQLANIITGSRIAVSLVLMSCQTFGLAFWICYVWCGVSDMIDGPVARKTGSVSRTGSILDSIADLLFVAVCSVKILPLIVLPAWLWIWVALIVVIKIVNLVSGFVCRHKLVMPHTIANKVTGAMLFALPIAIQGLIESIPTIIVCAVATFAAVQEGFFIRNNES